MSRLCRALPLSAACQARNISSCISFLVRGSWFILRAEWQLSLPNQKAIRGWPVIAITPIIWRRTHWETLKVFLIRECPGLKAQILWMGRKKVLYEYRQIGTPGCHILCHLTWFLKNVALALCATIWHVQYIIWICPAILVLATSGTLALPLP